MTDRAVVNHAAITKVESRWNKQLNELNCHLHPLDSISTACRTALKSLETTKGYLYGNDCMVGNLVLQINKFRFKDGKGDPKGFTVFLTDHGLPKGLLPRYRGNRLHVLFHICGTLHQHRDLFIEFFTKGIVSCGGLRESIRKDFETEMASLQIQCIGLLGKLITGPWMKAFYTSAASEEINHVEGISIVRSIVQLLKEKAKDPLCLLKSSSDIFGRSLDVNDLTLQSLLRQPSNPDAFKEMMVVCINSIIAVLERQYRRYFEMNITDQLVEETLSARNHNIDAEEVMGMFSAGKERAKNANLDFLVARMRAKKNHVVPYLDEMTEQKRERVITWAIKRGRQARKVDKRSRKMSRGNSHDESR